MEAEIPSALGRCRLIALAGALPDAFLYRARGVGPRGSVAVAADEYVVGYSLLCTHMGCRLLSGYVAGLEVDPPEPGVVRCPCHQSAFDLEGAGLVVIGPATDWLPLLDLELAPGPIGSPTAVTIKGWVREFDVGYGLPFGTTSGT